jgi:hypothetical protein
MAIDLGDDPYGTAPSPAEKLQIRTAIGLGQTDAPTFLAQTLTGQSLTGTQATNLVNLATTWDTTGSPSLIYGRVTNTNSGTTANLIDLGRADGLGLLKVSKLGDFTVGNTSNPFTISFSGNGAYVTNNHDVLFPGLHIGRLATIGLKIGFGSNIAILHGDAPDILAQRNGTAKQVHRVYNTFLGTTANEWGGFDWLTTANTLRIGTEHGGTGTARPIDFVVGGVVVAGLTSTALTSTNSIVGKLGTTASPSFSFAGRTDSGMFSFSSTEITLVIGGVNALRLQTGICTVNSGNIGVGGGFDANLSRIAGSSLAIGNGTLGDFSGSLKLRNVIQSPGVATIVTPASNGDLVFETTSNTSVTVKLKGSDGTVRSVVLTLA